MDYEEKIIKAISLAKTLKDLDYIESRLVKTDKINRRTVKGRELTRELLGKINIKARELIEAGELPF